MKVGTFDTQIGAEMKKWAILAVLLPLNTALLGCGSEDPNNLPFNEQVMYGIVHSTVPKNDAEREFLETIKEADRKFIEDVLSEYGTMVAASKNAVQWGWSYFKKKDYATSMRRFNQAWLLDKENGDAYYGFALITAVRDGLNEQSEKLFKIAISKPNVSVAAHVDYGRFLWVNDRLDESIERLKAAIEIEPKAYNAHGHISYVYYLKKNYSEACKWGKRAEDKGDDLEDGYLEDMCSKADEQSS